MKLTSNFSLEELSHTDHREFDNTPPDDVIDNLKRLAMILEQVRSLFNGSPVMVNSAYRSLEVNRAVGSSDGSQHRFGCAADIRIPGQTPDMVVKTIMAANLSYDQLIREFDAWVHISVPSIEGNAPRKMVLIIDKQGTRNYA
jgi:uncharacterized protein YcbK (DUF882 family)